MAEMKDESWVCDLAFLINTTTRMNELNTKLQRKAQYASENVQLHKRFYKQVETLACHKYRMQISLTFQL